MNVNGMSVCEIQNKLVGKVVVFNDLVKNSEIDFSPKMKAKIVGIRKHRDDNTLFSFCFDFKKFEEYNKRFSIPNYYDKNGKPTLHWHETKHYPVNGIACEYIMINEDLPFYLEEDLPFYLEEDLVQNIEDCSDKEKIDYLLKEVEALKKEIENLKNKH